MQIRTLASALLALTLVAAACAGDDDTLEAGDDPVVEDDGSATSTGGASDDGTPETEPPATAGGDDAATTTSTTTVAASGSEDPVTAEPPPSPGSVGSYAGFYLRPEESESLLVDVHSQSGAGPRAGTLDHLAAVLGQVSGKAVSVQQASLGGEAKQWTADELRALGDSVGAGQSRDRAVLVLLYVRGGFAENDQAIGVAVRSDVAAVFADRVDEAAGVLGNPAAIEDAVTMHEAGHVLGLVDLVLDTGREDPDHPGHSPNEESVMYYAVESTLIGTVLEGGPPRDFDQADLDDLARIRNR